MIELFGLGFIGTVVLLVGAGIWLIIGLIFGINGIREKRKKYAMGAYAGGGVRKAFSYSFALLLGIAFSPVLVVFWLGKRAGRKQVSG